jgi:IrrE N-terminal-like domain
MKWVPDTSGRFAERPHYEPDELDSECEAIVECFLLNRHGEIGYPISTDDLILMLEKRSESLDLYADLGHPDTWGETLFVAGKKPKVKIAKRLSENELFENPLRTTITHEFSHIHLHGFLFEMKTSEENLFTSQGSMHGKPSVCRRTQIQSPAIYDWLEWQAAYASGALLMPKRSVLNVVHGFRSRLRMEIDAIEIGTPEGSQLVEEMSNRFKVSREAAEVRLAKLGCVARESRGQRPLWG